MDNTYESKSALLEIKIHNYYHGYRNFAHSVKFVFCVNGTTVVVVVAMATFSMKISMKRIHAIKWISHRIEVFVCI